MPPQMQRMIEQFFCYAIPPTALLGSATASPIIQIGSDADFQAIWLVGNSTGTYTIRFTDAGTDRGFMNNPINNVNLVGTAANPFPMLPPYVFKRSQSIQITLVDTSVAANTIQIAFIGKKIFPSAEAGSAGVVVPA